MTGAPSHRNEFENWAKFLGLDCSPHKNVADWYASNETALLWRSWEKGVFAAEASAFDRARETSRRKTAVETLMSLGYQWREDHWAAPDTKDSK